jgi:hypothetical protein
MSANGIRSIQTTNFVVRAIRGPRTMKTLLWVLAETAGAILLDVMPGAPQRRVPARRRGA